MDSTEFVHFTLKLFLFHNPESSVKEGYRHRGMRDEDCSYRHPQCGTSQMMNSNTLTSSSYILTSNSYELTGSSDEVTGNSCVLTGSDMYWRMYYKLVRHLIAGPVKRWAARQQFVHDASGTPNISLHHHIDQPTPHTSACTTTQKHTHMVYAGRMRCCTRLLSEEQYDQLQWLVVSDSHPTNSGVRWLNSGVRWLNSGVRWLNSGVRWLNYLQSLETCNAIDCDRCELNVTFEVNYGSYRRAVRVDVLFVLSSLCVELALISVHLPMPQGSPQGSHD